MTGYAGSMWWLLFACVAPKLDDTGFGESVDTFPGHADYEGKPLEKAASWVSTHLGYATGGGFADLDGDGDPDLVVAYGNDMEPGFLVVYKNHDGRLEEAPSWLSSEAHYYGHLALGDVNGDGTVDVAVSRYLGTDGFSEPGGVQVFLNREGVLEESPSWEASGFFSFSCALGDMDGDGSLDLAVAVGEAYHNEPGRSRVFLNDGNGDFGAEPVWQTETDRHSMDVAWSDVDGNGTADLIFANQGVGHSLYLNRGGVLDDIPAWTAAAADGEYEGNSIAVGDVNRDEVVDLVITDNDQMQGRGVVRAWCGPDYFVCWEQDQAYASAVSLEDWDGDGDLDVFVGGWWAPVRLFPNRGGVLGDEAIWSSSADQIVAEVIDWADVDGDGWRDLLVTDWTRTAGNRLYIRTDP